MITLFMFCLIPMSLLFSSRKCCFDSSDMAIDLRGFLRRCAERLSQWESKRTPSCPRCYDSRVLETLSAAGTANESKRDARRASAPLPIVCLLCAASLRATRAARALGPIQRSRCHHSGMMY